MHTDDTFPLQKAPEKNTDNAFVQVGPDGSSVIPEVEKGSGPQESSSNNNADQHQKENEKS